MISRNQLISIRNSFSVDHVYSLAEYKPGHKDVEIGHFEGATYLLVHKVHEHCDDPKAPKAKWLIDVVFSGGKRHMFLTSKDIHIHVMTALDTIINMVPA